MSEHHKSTARKEFEGATGKLEKVLKFNFVLNVMIVLQDLFLLITTFLGLTIFLVAGTQSSFFGYAGLFGLIAFVLLNIPLILLFILNIVYGRYMKRSLYTTEISGKSLLYTVIMLLLNEIFISVYLFKFIIFLYFACVFAFQFLRYINPLRTKAENTSVVDDFRQAKADVEDFIQTNKTRFSSTFNNDDSKVSSAEDVIIEVKDVKEEVKQNKDE